MRTRRRRRRWGLILLYGLGAAGALSLGLTLTSPDARALLLSTRTALLNLASPTVQTIEELKTTARTRLSRGSPDDSQAEPSSSTPDPAQALWDQAGNFELRAALADARSASGGALPREEAWRDALSAGPPTPKAAHRTNFRPDKNLQHPLGPRPQSAQRSHPPRSNARALLSISWPEPPARTLPDYDGRSSAPLQARFPFLTLRGMTRAQPAVPLSRFTPPVLLEWTGPGPLKPPKDARPPDFDRLRAKTPKRLPFGGPFIGTSPPPPSFYEKLTPLDKDGRYAAWRKSCATRRFHWHKGRNGAWFYHQGSSWGFGQDGHWVWTQLQDKKWWADADAAALLRHEGRWWWKTREGWFLLHQGEPWAWRRFSDWNREGLQHPETGVRIVYSEDGLRAVLVLPTGDWALFDSRTGERLETGPP